MTQLFPFALPVVFIKMRKIIACCRIVPYVMCRIPQTSEPRTMRFFVTAPPTDDAPIHSSHLPFDWCVIDIGAGAPHRYLLFKRENPTLVMAVRERRVGFRHNHQLYGPAPMRGPLKPTPTDTIRVTSAQGDTLSLPLNLFRFAALNSHVPDPRDPETAIFKFNNGGRVPSFARNRDAAVTFFASYSGPQKILPDADLTLRLVDDNPETFEQAQRYFQKHMGRDYHSDVNPDEQPTLPQPYSVGRPRAVSPREVAFFLHAVGKYKESTNTTENPPFEWARTQLYHITARNFGPATIYRILAGTHPSCKDIFERNLPVFATPAPRPVPPPVKRTPQTPKPSNPTESSSNEEERAVPTPPPAPPAQTLRDLLAQFE